MLLVFALVLTVRTFSILWEGNGTMSSTKPLHLRAGPGTKPESLPTTRKGTSELSYSPETLWTERGGPYFPTTSEIGFLDLPRTAVVGAFVSWRTDLGQRPVLREVCCGLDSGIGALLPLTTVDRRRWVFFELGAWTAFFDNGARGTDAGPVASYLARTLACRGLRVVTVPDGGGTFGATMLEMYGPSPTNFLNYVRTISAANDGGRWRFDINGTPQSFEDEAAYSSRRVKDRFTPTMLARYLHALGVSAFAPDAYKSPVVVERTDDEPPNVEKLTLEQARARFTA